MPKIITGAIIHGSNTIDELVRQVEKAASQLAEFVVVSDFGGLQSSVISWVDNNDIPPNEFWDVNKRAFDINSSDFSKLKDTAKSCSLHLVFSFVEKMKSELFKSQAIISKDGELVLITRDLKFDEKSNYGFPETYNPDRAILLDYKSGSYMTGFSSIWDHLNPLSVQNVSTLYEQVHIIFITEKDFEKLPRSTNFDSLCCSNSQQTQTFSLAATPKGNESAIFYPEGLKIESTGDLFQFALDIQKCTIQKTFLDSVGHYSRPDMMSLFVVKLNE